MDKLFTSMIIKNYKKVGNMDSNSMIIGITQSKKIKKEGG